MSDAVTLLYGSTIPYSRHSYAFPLLCILGGSIQPFFVFPTGSSYHGVCCAAEVRCRKPVAAPKTLLIRRICSHSSLALHFQVIDLVGPQQQHRIKKLMADLSRIPRGGDGGAGTRGAISAQGSDGQASSSKSVLSLQRDLVAEVAGEDPRYGEVTVRLVDLPFTVFEADAEQEALWAI